MIPRANLEKTSDAEVFETEPTVHGAFLYRKAPCTVGSVSNSFLILMSNFKSQLFENTFRYFLILVCFLLVSTPSDIFLFLLFDDDDSQTRVTFDRGVGFYISVIDLCLILMNFGQRFTKLYFQLLRGRHRYLLSPRHESITHILRALSADKIGPDEWEKIIPLFMNIA